MATVADPARRADCETLVRLMEAATGERGQMWGGAIVGFGSYHYVYASGNSGDWPVVAFSPRKTDLSVYIMPGFESHASLLQRLGKHKTGKSCLTLKRLADVDLDVLRQLIEASVAAMAPQRVFPSKKEVKP
ncbi:MAG: DUF1801 domain-containing protein [Betaproteobacteria bacterium]|nr:DUF1801 domain-containing protein [Betaproteobacteria bacterium]